MPEISASGFRSREAIPTATNTSRGTGASCLPSRRIAVLAPNSLGVQAGLVDDVAPLGDLGLDVGGELVGGAGAHVGALLDEVVFHLGRVHHGDDLAVQAIDDRPRRAGDGEDAVPG